MRKTLGAAALVLLVGIAAAIYFGRQTIKQLEAEVEALAGEVAALESTVSERADDQDAVNAHLLQELAELQADDPEVAEARRDVDSLRTDLDRLRTDVEASVDGLYDVLADLVTTPPPPIGTCVLPDDATIRQDIRQRFRTDLNREPSDVELEDYLVDIRSAVAASCDSEFAALCIEQGGFYYAYTGECDRP